MGAVKSTLSGYLEHFDEERMREAGGGPDTLQRCVAHKFCFMFSKML